MRNILNDIVHFSDSKFGWSAGPTQAEGALLREKQHCKNEF